MAPSFDLKAITRGEPSRTGHVVYKTAIYENDKGYAQQIIYKENKNKKKIFSYFEVAFTSLARRCLGSESNPSASFGKR